MKYDIYKLRNNFSNTEVWDKFLKIIYYYIRINLMQFQLNPD